MFFKSCVLQPFKKRLTSALLEGNAAPATAKTSPWEGQSGPPATALSAQLVTSTPDTELRGFCLDLYSCCTTPELLQSAPCRVRVKKPWIRWGEASRSVPEHDGRLQHSTALPSPASQRRAPDNNRMWSLFLQYEGGLNGAFFSPLFPSVPEGRSQRCSWAGWAVFPGAEQRTPGYLTDSRRAFCPITGSWLCLTWISHSTPFLLSPDTTRISSLSWWAASHEVQPFVGSLFWSRCPCSSQPAA